MQNHIKGLHHVTSMVHDARITDDFFRHTLGLRRVKKSINYDAPYIYHLCYGNKTGSPGTVVTSFPFPKMPPGRAGTGEVGATVFSVPPHSIAFWIERLSRYRVGNLRTENLFGENRLAFQGPDGETIVLVEVADDPRTSWTTAEIGEDHAIRGFHSVAIRLRDDVETVELLKFMGYREYDSHHNIKRLMTENGNGSGIVELEILPQVDRAFAGTGSVHHVAFAVETRAQQLEMRNALLVTGYQVTPVMDRDYFWAIYFRTPGGVLFEIATDEPGFVHDEDIARLGEALKLPPQHAHLRDEIEKRLPRLTA